LTKHTIHRAQAFIQAHLDQSLSLAQIAEQVNLSAFHLTRLFKQTTGQALHQYVIAQRLERARQLIAQGKLPLKAVASQVGFADQSHLTRHFRRAFGITPRALMYEKHTHLHRLPDMPDSALDSKKEG
jgi:AraC family transcriptional regulator